MAMFQVQMVGGQKTLVPISGSAAVNQVAVNNLQPVSSNAVANALSYSATEHIVGYWTDGTTPVYEKTFVQSFINPSGRYFTSFTDLPNNINRVLDIYGMINGENSFCMNIPFGDTNYSQNWFTYVNYNFSVNYIYFLCGLNDAIPANTRVSIILTIRYTKSS